MMNLKKFDIPSLFPIDHPPFVRVILYYLKQHGITEFGGVSYFSQINYEDIETSLFEAGFKGKGYIDKLIIDEWDKADKTYFLFNLTRFAYNFQTNYRNWNIEKYTYIEVQNRNQKLKNKYYELVSVIDRLQGYLESFELRLRIDSNYIDRETIYQCLTPFCIISVKCDELGNFSIKYALAPDLRTIITDLLASILEKRILDTQMTDLKDYVKQTIFESDFKDRFTARLKENSLLYRGFKKDFPIYVLRNKHK